ATARACRPWRAGGRTPSPRLPSRSRLRSCASCARVPIAHWAGTAPDKFVWSARSFPRFVRLGCRYKIVFGDNRAYRSNDCVTLGAALLPLSRHAVACQGTRKCGVRRGCGSAPQRQPGFAQSEGERREEQRNDEIQESIDQQRGQKLLLLQLRQCNEHGRL